MRNFDIPCPHCEHEISVRMPEDVTHDTWFERKCNACKETYVYRLVTKIETKKHDCSILGHDFSNPRSCSHELQSSRGGYYDCVCLRCGQEATFWASKTND